MCVIRVKNVNPCSLNTPASSTADARGRAMAGLRLPPPVVASAHFAVGVVARTANRRAGPGLGTPRLRNSRSSAPATLRLFGYSEPFERECFFNTSASRAFRPSARSNSSMRFCSPTTWLLWDHLTGLLESRIQAPFPARYLSRIHRTYDTCPNSLSGARQLSQSIGGSIHRFFQSITLKLSICIGISSV